LSTCSENKLTAKAAKSAKKNKTSLRALCVLRGKISWLWVYPFMKTDVKISSRQDAKAQSKAISLGVFAPSRALFMVMGVRRHVA